jgi:hypothetical protein
VTRDNAPVYLDLSQKPVKHKRRGERVELSEELPIQQTDHGTYQPVLIRQGIQTNGWMSASDLDEANCSSS